MNFYQQCDQGPFLVFVESKTEDGNLGNLHRLSIANILSEAGVDHTNARRCGKDRVELTFDNPLSANKLIRGDFPLPTGWFGFIPDFKLFKVGIIRDVDINYDLNSILNVVLSKYPNSKVERLKRRP